jgi:hypothetical protein
MQQFYHWTNPENTKKILIEGLKKGKDLGIQNYYKGIPIDNKYIYLAKKLPDRFKDICESNDLLLVQLPEYHPVERDFDVSILFKSANYDNPLEALDMLFIFSELGVLNDKIDLSNDEGINELLLQVSDEKWDKIFSFYRTPLNIEPNSKYSIKKVDKYNILPL